MKDRIWEAIKMQNRWKNPKTIPRESTEEAMKLMKRPEAIYIYGPRRAGKSTVCWQMIERLKAGCLYINLEDPALIPELEIDIFDGALKRYRKENGVGVRYLFLDEVQNVDGWERWVRLRVDRKDVKIVVTGSSAKLLSSEFATSLTGRGLGVKILPFSYREYRKAKPKATLTDYMDTGGYPAVVLEKNKAIARKLLEEYFDATISKDISSRHEVRDVRGLRLVAAYVLTNSTKPISLNSLRSMTGLSFDSLRAYLTYLEDAFLVFEVSSFSYSQKEAMQKPRKFYAYDTGLASVVAKRFSPDLGRIVENVVGIELVRRGYRPMYSRNGADIDFIFMEGIRPHALNVCWTKDMPAREMQSLEKFSEKNKNAKMRMLAGKKEIEDWLQS